jgi:hypothetical protein
VEAGEFRVAPIRFRRVLIRAAKAPALAAASGLDRCLAHWASHGTGGTAGVRSLVRQAD